MITARSFGKVNEEAMMLLRDADCQIIRIDINSNDAEEQIDNNIVDTDAILAGLESYSKDRLALGKRLKVISRYGVGCDAINLNAAEELGISVTITPGANVDSVSDLAFSLMLSAARHIPQMDRSIRTGLSNRPLGIQMWKKTLGIIGCGRIGKGVALRAKGFGMKILCYDMYQDKEFAEKHGVQYCELDKLLRNSDFISLHAPLNAQTENMISAEQFEMMKNNAVIVNTARGGILNEEDLYHALNTGQIAAAALDATVVEPPVNSPLVNLENCILTPHAGAATYEASHAMSMMAAQNIVDVLETGSAQYHI